MDLFAHFIGDMPAVEKYINKHYGEVPRFRGARFMKLQKVDTDTPDENKGDEELMFDKYCGQDVIYIHTRCGNCGRYYDDEDSNYVYYGAKDWEDEYSELFLDHITDEYDPTYCTHYFKAVVDDEYNQIIKKLADEIYDVKGE